jgi:uncharacterized phage infection (PIP) family protein YhgE
VEGKGSATIHDVIFSMTPRITSVVPQSSMLKDLQHERKRLQKAFERCTESLSSLKAYLRTLNVQHLQISQLSEIMESYDAAAEQLDDKSLDLEEQISVMNAKIKVEQLKPAAPSENNNLKKSVGIDLSATVDGEIEITLMYGKASHPLCIYGILNEKQKPFKIDMPVGMQSTMFGRVWTPQQFLLYTRHLSPKARVK